MENMPIRNTRGRCIVVCWERGLQGQKISSGYGSVDHQVFKLGPLPQELQERIEYSMVARVGFSDLSQHLRLWRGVGAVNGHGVQFLKDDAGHHYNVQARGPIGLG